MKAAWNVNELHNVVLFLYYYFFIPVLLSRFTHFHRGYCLLQTYIFPFPKIHTGVQRCHKVVNKPLFIVFLFFFLNCLELMILMSLFIIFMSIKGLKALFLSRNVQDNYNIITMFINETLEVICLWVTEYYIIPFYSVKIKSTSPGSKASEMDHRAVITRIVARRIDLLWMKWIRDKRNHSYRVCDGLSISALEKLLWWQH